MRYSILNETGRGLMRTAALVMVGGLAASCSTDAMRFSDGLFTGSTSTANQRSIISKGEQPFPGDSGSRVAGVDSSTTGTVAPAYQAPPAAAPIQRAQLAAPSASASQPLPPPTRAAGLPSSLREPAPVMTSSAPSLARATVPASAAGELRQDAARAAVANPSRVVVQPGQTLSGIAARTGISSKAIMAANGIDSADSIRSGQTLVIPSADTPKAIAAAASETGRKTAAPSPAKSPDKGAPKSEMVAVLPSAPKAKEQAVAAASNAMGAKKADPKPAASGYLVQSGDSVAKIARKTGVDVAELKKANGITDGTIRVGQVLTLPAKSQKPAEAVVAKTQKVVDPITTASAGTQAKPAAAVAKAEPAQPATVVSYTPPQKKTESVIQDSDDEAPGATGIGKMRWPVRGRVISPFAKTKDGIDIAVPEGTPVKAAENGVVIYSGNGLKDFGNTVLVRHENGLVTVYGHASDIMVKRGDTVKRGQDIARSGMSGTTDVPKLHFEVRKDSSAVDPSTYLE